MDTTLKTNVESWKTNQFKPIEKITLVNKDWAMYEITSIYKNLIELVWKQKNKIWIQWFWSWEIHIWEKWRLEINISNTDGDWYQKVMAQSILINQQTRIIYNINDAKKEEALVKFWEIFKFDKVKAQSILDKILMDSRVSYEIVKEKDIEEMWGEQNFKHIQAIMRTIWWHDEVITFRIWPNDFFIKPDKLKHLIWIWKKEIKNLNEDHIKTEKYIDSSTKEEKSRKVVFLKKDKEWNLSSVWDEKYASLNYFQYWIYQTDFVYNTELRQYEKIQKRVWFLQRENDKREGNQNNIQEKQSERKEIEIEDINDVF